jgi:magnesium-transporting ATPase (P-type)
MESRNIALQGTLCTSGSGLGIAVGLGDGTVFGRIANQAGSERPVRTTLEVEILRFVLIIASLAFAVALLIVSAYIHYIFVFYLILLIFMLISQFFGLGGSAVPIPGSSMYPAS